MSEIDKSGEEITQMELFLKPPIYGQIKETIDNYYEEAHTWFVSERIDIFKTVEILVERCIVVALFEKYGTIAEITRATRIPHKVISERIVSSGLESIYGAKRKG